MLPSDLETYLPQELQSAAFKVSRFGIKEEEPLRRLRRRVAPCSLLPPGGRDDPTDIPLTGGCVSPSRFESTPPHPDRWDMALFAGGPVWPIEWCPTPDGSPEKQYVALACHRGMDDEHCVNKTYSGAGLVQLWDVGQLDSCSRCGSSSN